MSEIKELIEKLAQNVLPPNAKVATIMSVDADKGECDVSIPGEADVFGVNLRATEGKEGIVIIPKIGSQVLIEFISNEDAYVAMFSEVDYVSYAKGALSLRKELDVVYDKMDAILNVLQNKYKLMTNVGVTLAVTPDVIAELKTIQTALKQSHNNVQKLIK